MSNKTFVKSTEKELRKKYGKHGDILEMPENDLVIKYSAKARKNRLLKIYPKDKPYVEISVNDLIPIIIENFNIRNMRALDVDATQVQMIEVERTIKGTCDKNFTKGDVIEFNYRHMMPYEYAVAEEAMKLVKISGDNVTTVTKEDMANAAKSIKQSIVDFTKATYAGLLKKEDK